MHIYADRYVHSCSCRYISTSQLSRALPLALFTTLHPSTINQLCNSNPLFKFQFPIRIHIKNIKNITSRTSISIMMDSIKYISRLPQQSIYYPPPLPRIKPAKQIKKKRYISTYLDTQSDSTYIHSPTYLVHSPIPSLQIDTYVYVHTTHYTLHTLHYNLAINPSTATATAT